MSNKDAVNEKCNSRCIVQPRLYRFDSNARSSNAKQRPYLHLLDSPLGQWYDSDVYPLAFECQPSSTSSVQQTLTLRRRQRKTCKTSLVDTT